MKSIQELEQALARRGLLAASAGANVSITGVSNDSRKVKPGDLFICKGFGFKPEYLLSAREKGAVCYLAQEPVEGVALPGIIATDVRRAQGLTARWYYDAPSESFELIGVTGTKGKTTTCFMMQAVTSAIAGDTMGLCCGHAHYCGGGDIDSHLTTPEPLDLQWLFAQAREHRLPYMTAEVSSQAYQMGRLEGEHFNFGVFLNFGEDHVSPLEHPSMEEYLHCKLQLLRNSDVAVICRDTDQFDKVYAAARESCRKTILVGVDCEGCDFTAYDVTKEANGFSFRVQEKGDPTLYPYRLRMAGAFNVKNALTAIAVGRELGGSHEVLAQSLQDLVVPGRMNYFEGAGIHVLVDYMHNRISAQAVMDSVKQEYPDAHITVVIGVAGERSERRIQGLGEVCGDNADRIIFSTNDPSWEDPYDIALRLAAVAQGRKATYTIDVDRTRAVETAILEAPDGAVVVLAGKGDDDFQRIKGVNVHYDSDPVVAQRALAMRAELQKK